MAESLRYLDWVHPSVRDMVIEYLAEHDAERRRFLDSATAPDIVLAISVAGGAEGERETPLLRDEDDWSALAARIDEVQANGTPADRVAVLRGLWSATRPGVQGSPREVNDRLKPVAVRALASTRSAWDDAQAVLEGEALRAYYQLSVAAGHLAPSPELGPTWSAVLDRAGVEADAQDVAEGGLANVTKFLRLADLLSSNEPRFLKIVGFPDSANEVLRALLHWIVTAIDQASDLDEDEQKFEEFDDGNFAEIPVEPADEEYDERIWFGEAREVAELLAAWLPDRRTQLGAAANRAGELARVRERRQEHWDEFQAERESPEDYGEGRRTGPEFDIEAFFADL